ncbi:hypothetical protein K0H71_21770, partial [Bacillus sp. IITD106]|nr:hypothetical protein [Bacillus sp. IITD106]
YPPDLKSDLNNKEKNVFHGKLSLLPLKTDDGTIKLKITKLEKLIRDSSDQNRSMAYKSMAYEAGEWNFEIPVTKHPSLEYVLDEETNVEGIPVRFDKLTIAPTMTILHSSYIYDLPENRVNGIDFDYLQVNNKKVKADINGGYNQYENNNWISFQKEFDPLFVKKPKVLNIQFQSANLSVEDRKTIELDASKAYPQTFDYAGSTISIDKVEIGQPTKVVISNHDIKNRSYDWIHFDIMSDDDNEIGYTETKTEGVIVDKNGVEYDLNDPTVAFDEIEQPLYFLTVQNTELHSNNPEENVIPKRLEIFEYSTTKYLDDVVKISLK